MSNAVDDKTRILMLLLNRLYGKVLHDSKWIQEQRDNQPGWIFPREGKELKPGDLVTALTSINYNDYLVGYVNEVRKNCVVIREIGSDRLCEYYNEAFMRIDKDMLGYEALEGAEYIVYQKVLKAMKDSYTYRFGSIQFNGRNVVVGVRKVFSDEEVFTFTFNYTSKTSIVYIKRLFEKWVELHRRGEEKCQIS